MQFKTHESKQSPCKSTAGSGASGPHAEGKERKRSCLCREIVDKEGGQQEGWLQVLVQVTLE